MENLDFVFLWVGNTIRVRWQLIEENAFWKCAPVGNWSGACIIYSS